MATLSGFTPPRPPDRTRGDTQTRKKMTQEDILSGLCHYDTRNAYGVTWFKSEKENAEDGYGPWPRAHCDCDNCFYGKTKFAMHILKMQNNEHAKPYK
jgi:hypothetical protein